MGDVVQGVLLFRGAEGALDEAGKLRGGQRGFGWPGQIEEAFSGSRRRTNKAHGAEEFAAVQVHGPGCDIGVGQIWCFADQHLSPTNLPRRFGFTIILRASFRFGCWNPASKASFSNPQPGRPFLPLIHESPRTPKGYED